jgi:dTDP-glucose 4,6-dehydratase
MMNKVIVTGGCGFIGSALCEVLLNKGYKVINIDSLTYAGYLKNTDQFHNHQNYTFYQLNINDKKIKQILEEQKPLYIINCAAETHVDNSIKDPRKFVETNVNNTFDFLLTCMNYWQSKIAPNQFKFIQVSTDEVFGSLDKTGTFNELSQINPSSPYSSSKAASDFLALSLFKTYKFPVVVTNCSNNFGPRQHHEKLIPTIMKKLIRDQKVPIYGDGKNVRDWIYVYDHVDALISICKLGACGERYCIGGNSEKSNLELLQLILKSFNDYFKKSKSLNETIEFVTDRPGHDFRYAINNSKINNITKWTPSSNFSEKLLNTILYYIETVKNE